jgi:hypothetical protein
MTSNASWDAEIQMVQNLSTRRKKLASPEQLITKVTAECYLQSNQQKLWETLGPGPAEETGLAHLLLVVLHPLSFFLLVTRRRDDAKICFPIFLHPGWKFIEMRE